MQSPPHPAALKEPAPPFPAAFDLAAVIIRIEFESCAHVSVGVWRLRVIPASISDSESLRGLFDASV